MQHHEHDNVPVPRNRIFALNDGTFVVQWEENRVQGLLTGRYYPYTYEDFGNAITNYELNQLQKSNVVNSYDSELVYLSSQMKVTPPTRTYYLNTVLPKSQILQIEAALQEAELSDQFTVRMQEGFVIVRLRTGKSFATFDEAERAREILIQKVPDLFSKTAVAFVEVNAIT